MSYLHLDTARLVRAEATDLLRTMGIEAQLARYGVVNLIGSYAYDVMVARDIDFHVIVRGFDVRLAKQFFDYAVDSEKFEYISFHDKHHFNEQAAERYPSKWALDSYYFGLRTHYQGHEWQIGVNFITQPQEASVEIGHLFETVTDAQRERIVDFKTRLQTLGIKVSSAYVYRAVIQKDIADFDRLLVYLRGLGYIF